MVELAVASSLGDCPGPPARPYILNKDGENSNFGSLNCSE